MVNCEVFISGQLDVLKGAEVWGKVGTIVGIPHGVLASILVMGVRGVLTTY
jgi:hypothetical protein